MAFTISGSLAIDETTGTQNAADTGDSSGNDISGGTGVLPSEFDSVLLLEGASSATAIGAAVSGATADNSTGTDLLTGLGADVINLAFTDSAGNALDGDAAKFGPGAGDFLRTTDGTQIFLYTSQFDDNVVLGRKGTLGGLADPAGAVVFAAYLDTHTVDPGDAGATGAKVWLVEYATILHGTAGSTATAHDDARFLTDPLYVTVSNRTEFSLEGAPSGQNLFLMFGDGTPSATEVAIVVTADNPVNQSGADPNSAADDLNISGGGTVNTGQGGGGTTLGHTNQMIDPGEGLYFTFVTGANPDRTVPNLTQGTDPLNGADVEANIDFTGLFAATGANFAIVQLQPPKETALTISAMNTALETKTDYIDGLGDADDVLVNINFIKVSTFVKDGNDAGHELDAGPTATFTASGTNAATGITATFNPNGTVTLSGIEANDVIEYRTGNSGGSLTHSRVLIENTGVTNNIDAAFDIGKFSLVNASTNPQAFPVLSFQDDGPTVSANSTVLLDDDAVSGAGGNAGGSGDDVDSANTSGTLGHAFGVDGAGTVAYLTTGAPSGFSYELSGTSLLIKQGTTTVLTLTMVAGTGAYTVAQNNPILHAAGSTENNQTFTVSYQVTDGDGDTAAGTLGINVDDDTPVVTAKSNLVYANASNPTPGGTGFFDYSIGADARTTYSALSSDLTVALTGGTVGTNAISNMDVDWASEDGSQAQFNVAFTYVSDPTSNTTTNATGTLTFDKVAGTYTLALAQPISSFDILSTANAQGFTGYLPNTSTIDTSQPEVTVAALANNFFVQFTGYSEPGGGVDNNSGNNNLDAIGVNVPVTDPAAPGDDAFVNGEVFKQAISWASVSGTAAGVAGDTMQQGEVLDLDFFATNPTGFSSLAPTTTSSAIFLQFDALDNNEDLVLILKLVDSTNPANKTTKAVIADFDDIFHKAQAASIPPAFGFTGTLDNNDGLVVIENQDFNGAGEHWLIEGAQVLASTEGVSGTGINLNGAIGAGGASTTTQTFADATDTQNTLTGTEAGTWDGDVFKIVNIGFVTAVTPDAHLTFDAAVTDNDGDTTATQTLDVNITSGTTFTGTAAADAIQGSSGADTITGGAGADVMSGGAGADQFVFASGASGITLATADTVSDFVTGVDKLATSKAAGAATIADGGALADFAAFVTGANAVLTAGAGANDVYAAYNAAASGNAWVVVDENDTGSVDAGDTLVVLTGVNLAGEIAAADFI